MNHYKQFVIFYDDGTSHNPQQRMFNYIDENELQPLCYFKTAAFYELNKRKRISNHAFSFANTWNEFYSKMKHLEIKILHTKQPTLHTMEIIKQGQKCKPYLDIEFIMKDKNEYVSTKTSFLDTLINDIITIFKNEYKQEIKRDDIYISDASRQTDDRFKASFHVVVSPSE